MTDNLAISTSNDLYPETLFASNNAWKVNASNYFVIGSNIGIGTSNPGSPLDIVSSTMPYLRIISTNYNEHANLQLTTLTGSHTIYRDTNNLLRFHNGNADVMTLSNTNIGIGTSNPSHTLDINGSMNIGNPLTDTYLQSPGQLHLSANSSGNESYVNMIFSIGSNGYAGQTGLGYGFIWMTQNSNNTQHMVLTNSGQLGIGINIPTYDLDINGTIHASSNLIVDQHVQLGYSTGNNSNFGGSMIVTGNQFQTTAVNIPLPVSDGYSGILYIFAKNNSTSPGKQGVITASVLKPFQNPIVLQINTICKTDNLITFSVSIVNSEITVSLDSDCMYSYSWNGAA